MREDQYQRENVLLREDFPVLLGKFEGKWLTPYGPYYHPAMEFHLYRRGNGHYFIRDANYPLGVNTVIITHKNEVHAYVPDPEPSLLTDTHLLLSDLLLKDRPVSCAALRRLEQVHHLVLSNSQAIVAEFLLNNIRDDHGIHPQRVIGVADEILTVPSAEQMELEGRMVIRTIGCRPLSLEFAQPNGRVFPFPDAHLLS